MILYRCDCMSHYTLCPFTQVVKLFWSWVILEEFFSISMSDFRETLWKNNSDFKEALLKYVGQGLWRQEMLDLWKNNANFKQGFAEICWARIIKPMDFSLIFKWFYFDNAITFAYKFDCYFNLLSIVLFPLFCSHVPFYFQFDFFFFYFLLNLRKIVKFWVAALSHHTYPILLHLQFKSHYYKLRYYWLIQVPMFTWDNWM